MAKRLWLPRLIRRVLKDRSGSVLVYTALALPILAGVAGLSVDISLWHVHKRVLQKAADAAAIAGALEILRTGDQAKILQAVELSAAANGYDGGHGDVIAINHPPTSGPNAGASDSVAVVLRRQAPVLLAGLFMDGMATVAARAVAVGDVNDTCVWALNPFEQSAISVSGGAQAHFGCGIIANSSNSQAVTQDGTGSCITATKIKVAGGVSGDCIRPAALTGVRPVKDPLAAVQPPSYGGCDHIGKTKINSGETGTLSPGVYCGDIEISGTAHFEPGLYVLDGATLRFGAQAVITGSGVHFYLTEDSPAISITAGASVSLSAGTTGDLAGILIYQNRNAPANITHGIEGGANMNLAGILYFPSTDVKFSGGSAMSLAQSLLVADTVAFTGNSNLGDFEGSPAQANKSLVTARLVE